jgi:hypothetical protein
MSELELLKLVTSRLKKAGINYMVSGSMAMTFYAKPRMTRDIDIVINIKQTDVDVMMQLFEADFYIDKGMMEEAIRYRSMFNIIHLESLIKIDFIIRKNEEYRIIEFKNRKKIKIGEEVKIDVVSLEDLIISKLYWAKDSLSEIQINDIRNLMKSDYNLEYVQRWCKNLNLEEILAKVNNERHK